MKIMIRPAVSTGTENSVLAAGNDAMEILERAPGVTVDKDDNISISGKNGVQVFIDGKPSPLAGKDLSEYLKTLQSAQIESIEIITNPSAKYEAAGNAGIINIRLKKVSHFSWLLDRSNLLFSTNLGFSIQNNYQSLFKPGTGNC